MGGYAIPFAIGSLAFSFMGICSACDFIKSFLMTHKSSNKFEKRIERTSIGGVIMSVTLFITGALMSYYFILQALK